MTCHLEHLQPHVKLQLQKKKKSSQAIDSLAVFDCTLEAGDSQATGFLLFYTPYYTNQINLQMNSLFPLTFLLCVSSVLNNFFVVSFSEIETKIFMISQQQISRSSIQCQHSLCSTDFRSSQAPKHDFFNTYHSLLVLPCLSHFEKHFHQLDIQATPTISSLLYYDHRCSKVVSGRMKGDFRDEVSLEYECLEEKLQYFSKKVFTS